jgi:ATP-dependent phosphofructokinase / diphosphate-dependent phosphofructokinase
MRGNAFIAHGGGPTAVLNASLLGAVEAARRVGVSRFWAAIGGLGGYLTGQTADLLAVPAARIARLARQAGSFIGCYRGAFDDAQVLGLIRYFREQDIRYCFYTGGNGSMGTALRIARAARAERYELYTVGIPKTIDNDIVGTDHAPGFGTAARFVALAVRDMGLDQRSLPTPVSICEVMGRDTGWQAAASILARGKPDDAPHFIYTPERPFDEEEFLTRIDRLLSRQGWVMGVVAEAVRDRAGRVISESGGANCDAWGRPLASNVAIHLAGLVSERLKVRARSEKPGLLCRAFTPTVSPVDWVESRMAGDFAVRLALRGENGVMAAFRRRSGRYRCDCVAVPLARVAGKTRTLPQRYLPSVGVVDESYRDYVTPLVGPAFDLPEALA